MQIQSVQPILADFVWPQPRPMEYPNFRKYRKQESHTLAKEPGKGDLIDIKA